MVLRHFIHAVTKCRYIGYDLRGGNECFPKGIPLVIGFSEKNGDF